MNFSTSSAFDRIEATRTLGPLMEAEISIINRLRDESATGNLSESLRTCLENVMFFTKPEDFDTELQSAAWELWQLYHLIINAEFEHYEYKIELATEAEEDFNELDAKTQKKYRTAA